MATRSMLIAELRERIGRLRSVTAFTRNGALSYAMSELSVDDLAWYLQRVLPVVERFIERVELPGFRELCDRLRDVDDIEVLAAEFGVQMEFALHWWAIAGFQCFGAERPLMALAAIANSFAMPVLEVHQNPMLWGQSIANLASLLGLDYRHHEGVGLYEFVLEWTPDSYRDRNTLLKTIQAFAPDRIIYLSAVANITGELVSAGRYVEAEEVTFAALGFLDGETPGSAYVYQSVVKLMDQESLPQWPQAGRQVSGEMRDALKSSELAMEAGIVQALRQRHPRLSAELVERIAGFVPDRELPVHVARRLQREYSGPYSKRSVEMLLGQYAACLSALERPEDVVAVVEGLIGIEQGFYLDPSRLVSCLSSYKEKASPLDGGSFLFSIFTTSLRRIGRAGHAVAILESVFDSPGDGDRLKRAIDGARSSLRAELPANRHAVGAVASWIRSLAKADRQDDAYRVAWEVLGDLEWFAVRDGRLIGGVSNLLVGAIELLLRVAPRNPAFGIQVCRRTIEALRASIADARVSVADRRRFQEEFADIRQLIVRLGHDWVAAAAIPSERRTRWTEALSWDAELGQRAVLERFLEGPPSGEYGTPLDLPSLIAESAPAPSPSDGLEAFCFDRTMDPVPLPVVPMPENREPAEADGLTRQLSTGIGPGDLARGMLPSERLLRAGFTSDERLVWAILATEGNTLRVLIDGVGDPGDRSAIVVAARRYDAELKLVGLPGRFAADPNCRNHFSRAVAPALFALDELQIAVETAPLDASAYGDEFFASVERNLPQAGIPRLKDVYVEYFSPPPLPEAIADWTAERRETLARLRLLLAWPDDAATAKVRRDAPTEAFIRAVARVWPVNQFIDGLAPDTDLMIQVDDVLHAVPVPYLPLCGGFLFEAVKSVRCVLSAVLNGWLADQERRRPAEPASRRGLVLSWFDPEDGAKAGAAILRQEVIRIAGRLDWQSAEGRTGTHTTLGAATEAGPLEVVVVCAHGHDAPAGVRLGDGVWGGARAWVHKDVGEQASWQEAPGANLEMVEFLIQVSCSIGRVEHGEGQDIGGFCIEAAVAGGRSVLAGKWPIAATESPVFAARVAAEYQKLRDVWPAGRAVGEGCLRARAVAAARHHFRHYMEGGVGLNTAAAFDLYGLG